MIHTIRAAFNELLAENVWMDDETRAVAKEKADAMNERIGYPDLLMDGEQLSKEYTNVSKKHPSQQQIKICSSVIHFRGFEFICMK